MSATTTAQKPTGHVYLPNDPTPIPYIQFGVRWLQLLTPCCGALATEFNNGFQNLSYCNSCQMELGLDYGIHWLGRDDLLDNGYVIEQPAPLVARVFIVEEDEEEELL